MVEVNKGKCQGTISERDKGLNSQIERGRGGNSGLHFLVAAGPKMADSNKNPFYHLVQFVRLEKWD